MVEKEGNAYNLSYGVESFIEEARRKGFGVRKSPFRNKNMEYYQISKVIKTRKQVSWFFYVGRIIENNLIVFSGKKREVNTKCKQAIKDLEKLANNFKMDL